MLIFLWVVCVLLFQWPFVIWTKDKLNQTLDMKMQASDLYFDWCVSMLLSNIITNGLTSSFFPFPSFSLSLSFFLSLGLFRAACVAYGGFQARGQIGAVASGLCHNHSNTRSRPQYNLHHSSQQSRILTTEWGQGSNRSPHGC